MNLIRVSNLELYRVWRDSEDLDLNWLVARLRGETEATPAMKAGTAFHKAIELAQYSDFETISANGYTFHFDCDCEIEIPSIREIRGFKKYGDLMVTGQCDAIAGRAISDHKTTDSFDGDRYMSGYQWRFYLDIFEADVFRWNIFEIKECDDPLTYVVRNYHRLEQRRYPDMQADCSRLASEFSNFVKSLPPDALTKSTLESQLVASIEQAKQRVSPAAR